MREYFEVMEAQVAAHNGTVDKYMGDCVMALFGVPQALERAPFYAIQSALEMVSRFQTFTRSEAASSAS